MKLDEIYNIDEVWNKIDAQFNRENHEERSEQLDRYEEIATLSQGHTPVVVAEPAQEEKWNNHPQKDAAQSPGYRAGESVKKGAGVPYKKYNKAASQASDFPLGTF